MTALIVYAKLEEKESADHLFARLVHHPECVVSSRPVLNVSALVNLVLQALGSVRQIISAWMNLSGVTVILFLTHAIFYYFFQFMQLRYLLYLGVEDCPGDESNCITTSNYNKLE